MDLGGKIESFDHFIKSTVVIMCEDTLHPNEIIRFLNGTWKARDVLITADKDTQNKEYTEIMKIKDADTLTITAVGYDDGRDLTRDLTIELGKGVVMRQGTFTANGTKDANCISLEGFQDSRTYRFRLYLLGDKFIFQRDVIDSGNLVEAQMSYLTRVPGPL